MTSEREKFETRSAGELFGLGGELLNEVYGVEAFYRVADNYQEFVDGLEARGLGVSASHRENGDVFGNIMNGTEGLDFPFHYYTDEKDKGVWISDIDWYERLMRVEK